MHDEATIIEIDLIEKYKANGKWDEYKNSFNRWSKTQPHRFTYGNIELDLKAGDIVSFISGYDENIRYTTEILAFNKNGDAFVVWDCYWLNLDLVKRKFTKIKSEQ